MKLAIAILAVLGLLICVVTVSQGRHYLLYRSNRGIVVFRGFGEHGQEALEFQGKRKTELNNLIRSRVQPAGEWLSVSHEIEILLFRGEELIGVFSVVKQNGANGILDSEFSRSLIENGTPVTAPDGYRTSGVPWSRFVIK